MNLDLIPEAELADALGYTPEQVQRLRWRHRWPHLGRGKAIRYTPAQVEAVLASLAYEAKPIKSAPPIAGQTERSARRSA